MRYYASGSQLFLVFSPLPLKVSDILHVPCRPFGLPRTCADTQPFEDICVRADSRVSLFLLGRAYDETSSLSPALRHIRSWHCVPLEFIKHYFAPDPTLKIARGRVPSAMALAYAIF